MDPHPAVAAARRLADEVLAPAAADVDAGTVPRSHLDALAAQGLLGVAAPASVGGLEASPAVVREVQETLAGACLSTWFVQVQHHAPLGAAVAAGRDDVASDLAAGRRVAGIAFSHLRRHPARPVVAERDGAGWRLSGSAPWYTGWGLNDVALLGGESEDGDVVLGLVPAREQDGLRASPEMELAALRATRTVALSLDGVRVAADDVLVVRPWQEWAAQDARPTRNPVPAVFGVARSALDLLDALAERRGEPAAAAAASGLRSRLDEVRAEAYHLLDDVDPDAEVERRLDVRARAHETMLAATTALVVAGAGASMASSNPAQRKAREALFLLVQAQTHPARTRALHRLAATHPA